jgi:metal-responsive CopG/Arc/MetJ family transcriptional regulator
MSAKASITLPTSLLVEIDRLIGESVSRSAFVEKILRDYLQDEARRAIHARDKELIDAAADRLNEEAEDVLRYQAPYL